MLTSCDVTSRDEVLVGFFHYRRDGMPYLMSRGDMRGPAAAITICMMISARAAGHFQNAWAARRWAIDDAVARAKAAQERAL